MLSKKYYEKIATALFYARSTPNTLATHGEYVAYLTGINEALDRLVMVLADDNPRFNEGKFRDAAVWGKGV